MEQGFLYGLARGPMAELGANGNVVSRFVYGVRSTAPDYMTRGGRTYAIVGDQLGSPRSVVDTATGQVVQEMDFDDFGRVTRDTNPGFQPFGFAGGLYDRDTGLVRFGARDYDPRNGRWTTKDPIGLGGGDANLYAYAGSDPVNRADPDGLYDYFPLDDWAGDGYEELTSRAEEAATFYADIANDACASGLLHGGAHLGGWLSSLATKENLPETALTLIVPGAGAARYLGRPFWRYVGPRNAGKAPTYFALRKGTATLASAAAVRLGVTRYASMHSGRLLTRRAQRISNRISGRTGQNVANVVKTIGELLG